MKEITKISNPNKHTGHRQQGHLVRQPGDNQTASAATSAGPNQTSHDAIINQRQPGGRHKKTNR
ncbi:hypothetical protein CIK05_08875 [Bdellovibrio sp. qaytius]|nr:hypothetical protein CIK05_08875 [Bdellovibrio sp. qaytius]